MKKTFLVLVLLVTLLFNIRPVQAAAPLPWNNHAPPWTFLFNNHIDMHQQSQKIDGGNISGFLYVHQIGKYNGLPLMEHTDCSMTTDCVAGWSFQGIPAVGEVVGFDPQGMAIWCTAKPVQRGYSHFHWLNGPDMDMAPAMSVGDTFSGYILKLVATSSFYFVHHAGAEPMLIKAGIDTVSHKNIAPTCP